MNIGWAVETILKKKRVAREGWNGKGMCLYLIAGVDVHSSYVALIDTKGIHTPWNASQADLLAQDWIEVE